MDIPFLEQPVHALSGIAERLALKLSELNIHTIGDLLLHFPRTYQDRRKLSLLKHAVDGERITVCACILSIRLLRLRKGMTLVEANLQDESGTLRAIWFGRPYLVKTLPKDTPIIFSGLVGRNKGLVLRNPDFEVVEENEEPVHNCLTPIYPLCEGLHQRSMRRYIAAALDRMTRPQFEALDEVLPDSLRAKYGYPSITKAFHQVHFPDTTEEASLARNRFAYEELLGMQLGLLGERAKRLTEETGIQHHISGPVLERLKASLPFSLTDGQHRAVADVLHDMASPRPMLRLLQGDVGCGKTMVALHAVAAAADSGYQTALMAPTEVLAEQHLYTLREQLEPLGILVEGLTGGTKHAMRVRSELATGQIEVVVGTHALFQENTTFKRLGLIIVDEQHRFGVLQRNALAEKGLSPDVLHMTATPIPRTLAITVFGGMDISIIDEMPPGRIPVKTRRIPSTKVDDMYAFIHKEVAAGGRVYYICPLVEESDKMDLRAVTTHCAELSSGPLAGLRVGLLHGRLPSTDKESVISQFRRGELDVLFSTTVVEVGVDCPEATLMIIEDAGRFGLTQLHQLRGRVGRGHRVSYCLLLGAPQTPEGRERLRVLCETHDGFAVAEADLALRGPGELLGVRQAGWSDLRIADLIRDVRILDAARNDAQTLLDSDPLLKAPEYRKLREKAAHFAQTML